MTFTLTPVLTANWGTPESWTLDAYRRTGGYGALGDALKMAPDALIQLVKDSGLRGRGGAGFPTGMKWGFIPQGDGKPHYLVVNADESEPGTCKDIPLMMASPHTLLEGVLISAYAIRANRAFIYVRGEVLHVVRRLLNAVDEAKAAGLIGSNVLGSGFDIDVVVHIGAGAYICGEETALLESIEGKRGEPRRKPPFPVLVGLFGKPTVMNNVETLANVIPILLEGGAAFARTGTEQSTGTRLFCLSGAVERPGVYEVPFGTSLRSLLELAGARDLKAVLLGGAAGSFLRPDEIDLPLSLEGAHAASTTLGSGVIMAFDQSTDLHEVVRRIAGFFRDESCGQCVPCRVGTVRQEEALHRIAHGKTLGGVAGELALLEEVGVAMRDASICGLGQTAYAAVESAIKRLRLYEVTG